MNCKQTGMCKSAAACFLNAGCIFDDDAEQAKTAAAKASDDRYREGYSAGWKDARAAQQEPVAAPQQGFGQEVTWLVTEIRKPCSMAWRDSLVEKLIELIDPLPDLTPQQAAAPGALANPRLPQQLRNMASGSTGASAQLMREAAVALDRLTAPSASGTPEAPTDDAKDAARYRWLRDNCYDFDPAGDGDAFDHPALHFESSELDPYNSGSLDLAIDADMRAAQLDGGQEGSAT